MSSNQEEQDLDRKAQDLLNLREAVEKPNFQDALDNSEKFKNTKTQKALFFRSIERKCIKIKKAFSAIKNRLPNCLYF